MGVLEIVEGVALIPFVFVVAKIALLFSDNTSGFWFVMVLAFVLLVGGGGLYYYDSQQTHWLAGMVKISGDIVGDNYVDNSSTVTHNGVASGTTTHTYTLNYRYTAAGVSYTSSGTTLQDPAGLSQIDVYYNPAQPGKSTLDPDSVQFGISMRNLGAVAAMISAVVLVVVGGWKYSRS
jgi:hypothetical protein